MGKKTRKYRKLGQSPGQVIYTGSQDEEPVQITLLEYNENSLSEAHFSKTGAWLENLKKDRICWLHVQGLHKEDIIRDIGKFFSLHPLVLEDIVHVGQRPKMENFADYIFFSLKHMTLHPKDQTLEAEHVSVVFGRGFVLSFQDKRGDLLKGIRERLIEGSGRIRRRGADYLGCAILDTVVDNYFFVIEDLGDIDAELEDMLLASPEPETFQRLREQKKRLLVMRKNLWPFREGLSRFERSEPEGVESQNLIFFRDVYDHLLQIIDMTDTRIEINAGLSDLYMSALSQRMNEVMKVLTLIATIFIPLTFIAGIYGMNFEFMPELKWPWGYFAILGLMVMIGAAMVLFFKKKKWL